MVADGLVIGSSGNISVRVDEHHFVVTAAGVPYDELGPADHPVVDAAHRRVGGPAAADQRDRPAHRACSRAMPDVGAVVHTHSRYAAAFSVARLDLPFICNESIATRAERVLVTDYAPPGSVDLGEQALATFRAQPGSRAVLLANHGVVAIGPTRRRGLRRRPVRRVDGRDLPPRPHAASPPAPASTSSTAQVRDAIARNYGVTIAEAELMDADDADRPLRAGAAAGRGRLLPPATGGRRDAARADRHAFLVTDAPDGFSQFHRLDVDEIWHFYLGDPLELVLLEPGGTSRHVLPRPRRARRRRGGRRRAGRDVDGRPDHRALEPVRHDDGARLHRASATRAATATALLAGWPDEIGGDRGAHPAPPGP